MAIIHANCEVCIRGPSPCQHSSVCNEETGYTKFHPTVWQTTEELKETKEVKNVTQTIPQLKHMKPGASADYYVLPVGATQLQDLIAFRNMNAQLGEIFRTAYRYGQPGHHFSQERDLRKIIFYAEAELARLVKYPS